MKKKDLDSVAEVIVKEIQKTQDLIEEYKEMTKPIAPENAIGRLSRMDAINNKSVTEAALRKAEEKLRSLKYLKDRVNEDDFGLCRQCKQPIPLPRLMFMPQSQFCVNCAD